MNETQEKKEIKIELEEDEIERLKECAQVYNFSGVEEYVKHLVQEAINW
jgi:hypothetical protein